MRWFRGVLLVIGLALLLIWLVNPAGPSVAPGSTLVVQLSGTYTESAELPLFSRLFADARVPFASLYSELRKAERDDRLSAVVFRIRDLGNGWAQAQELRDAIRRLSAAGRHTIAYLEVMSFAANIEYYVASAADEVRVSAATHAALTGLAAEYLFLGGLWEKLGIDFEVERVGRYKGATETISGKEMSQAYREVANSVLDSINDQFISGIAEGRGLTEEFVARAIDSAPMNPSELKALGLIDKIEFFDETIESLDGPVINAADYARVDLASVGFDPVAQFALVYGSGNVVVGKGRTSSTGAPVLASDTVSAALEDAAKDPDIDAIIFRIDSSGGSVLASEIVWRASQMARKRGKPLIASFSNTAASGGYYVASAADAIVAAPGSITGSIGVFVLRPVLAGALDKLDIGVETLTRGAHAGLSLSSKPLSEATRARLRDEVRAIYELFVGRVAEGRKMTTEQVDELARGRVWTGAQAFEIGLVDGLGGLSEAVARAKSAIGLDEHDDVTLVPYPPPGSLIDQLGETVQRLLVQVIPATSLPGLAGRVQQLLDAAPWEAPALVPPMAIDIR